MTPRIISEPERFWKKVTKTETCWTWTGWKGRRGYGKFLDMDSRKVKRAHRKAWEMANGPIPDGMWVLHKCDNPPCVRPDHLFLGTVVDNTQDMILKGRSGIPIDKRARGEKISQSKLVTSDVAEIRRLCSLGIPRARIAENFGISSRNVGHILRRRTWAHVP